MLMSINAICAHSNYLLLLKRMHYFMLYTNYAFTKKSGINESDWCRYCQLVNKTFVNQECIFRNQRAS